MQRIENAGRYAHASPPDSHRALESSLPRFLENRTFARALRAVTLLLIISCPLATSAEPWRLQDQLDEQDWLSVSGSYRLRYEWQENTFRAADPGTDALLVSRFLFSANARLSETFRIGAQLQDSRTWGSEPATPLGIDDVNAFEPL